MSRVEAARESRKGATVILTHLIKLKPLFKEKIFCLFEGDDQKYYSPRIANFTQREQESFIPFTCGGKKEVTRLLRLVENSIDLKEIQAIFFIDKDFDEKYTHDIQNKIYETPCYSIENFYTSPSSFSRILKGEFMYNEAFEEYELLMNLYKSRQNEFHNAILLFNAWIACQREHFIQNPQSSEKVNLGGFNLRNLINDITIQNISSSYRIETIYDYFPKAPIIPVEILEKKVQEFEANSEKGKLFRGKFEIYFLRKFIESLLSELRSPTSTFTKRPGVHLTVSNDNIISELSQYAETPACLQYFLANCVINNSPLTDAS